MGVKLPQLLGLKLLCEILHQFISSALILHPLLLLLETEFQLDTLIFRMLFKEMVLKDIATLKTPRFRSNREFQSKLKHICIRNDIVIRPANKGRGVVILNKIDNLTEMNRLLSDNATYSQLPFNPTIKFKKELVSLINEGFSLGVLNKKERIYLVPSAPRVPVIYYLPKVHKSMSNLPGRPIRFSNSSNRQIH